MDRSSAYRWIFNRLSYVETFLLICFIFFISFLPIAYFWVTTHLQQMTEIDHELEEIDEEFLLKRLFSQIELHRRLTQEYLYGDTSLDDQIQSLNDKIHTSLNEMFKIAQTGDEEDLEKNRSVWKRMDSKKILEKWETFILQTKPPSLATNEVVHTSLLQNLQLEFAYLTSQISNGTIKDNENYILSESLSVRLPFLQENISLYTLLKNSLTKDENQNLQRDRMQVIGDRIDSDLNYLERNIEVTLLHNPDAYDPEILTTWKDYHAAVVAFLKHAHTKNQSDDPKSYQSELTTLSEKALKIGYKLWDLSLNKLKSIFIDQKNRIAKQMWLVLLLTLFLAGIAFVFGIIASRLANVRLIELTQATESFTNGNLSVRVPEIINDEIGRQAQAFNRMAEKLQEMLSFLYDLLNATTKLSKGDLSARLAAVHYNSEFDEVSQSFNHMAETFQTIIGKLQSIAAQLTGSATEITKASLEQEKMIVGQETTTNDIALAASAISSTAKELATKMNVMNDVAEETSTLAIKGKDSLTRMESIMHQMVKASNNISSRLSILNEKISNITSIVTAITKVADQTNLLSLNASIEAEKAGEFGKSFAVIAREIRRLADQTALSTLDIEKLVNEILKAVSTSVVSVNEFSEEIHKGVNEVQLVSEQQTKIIEQVEAFTSQFEIANQTMQTQSSGAEQIHHAISQLSQKANQTSEAIHQLHKTIQELHSAAKGLQIMSTFTADAKKPLN